ncbi:MAG TPA: hypothetical protein VGL93_14785 [Streptosporangiaceae bacterium]|jgi:hypothetical protein
MRASTDEHVALAGQLVALAESRLLDPLEILTEDPEVVRALRERIRADAEMWAAQLLGEDDALARHTGARMISAFYPGDAPFEMPAPWWRTPLGRAVALRMGHPSADIVPYAVAAAMLGITRQGVHDLVRRGKLARDDAGVTTASVRARLRARTDDHGNRR